MAAGISDPTAWADKKVKDEAESRRQADERAKADAARKAEFAKAAEAQREAAEKAEAARAEMNRNPATKMKVANFSWKTGGFGSVAIVSITIANENDFPVKDFLITCSFSAKSGTQVSAATQTVYDTIKAKTKRTFPEVNVGFINSQAARASCDIALAKRA